jgi:integrase
MKSSVTIRPIKHPRYKFRVSFKQGGDYAQKYFRSKAEAKNFAEAKNAELQNVGVAERGVTPEEFRALLDARKIAESLTADHVTVEFSFLDAVEFYAAHLRQTKASVTVKHAVAKFLDYKEREKRSAVHLRNLTSRANAFEEAFGKRIIATLTKEDVRKYLFNLGGATRTQINHRLVLSNLFNFAVEQNWMAENPVATITLKADETTPGILAPEQVAAFLNHAEPRILPAYAIAFFAGLREAEIARLDWKDIKLERGHIDLSGSKTKSGNRRLVKITPNLKRWLEPHRQPSGPVRPSDQIFRRSRAAACKAAGIEEWPQNAARHCFGSYHLAAYQNANVTALELGHKDTEVLFKHYREIVTHEEGEAYFAIMPQDAPTNIIRMEDAA